MSQIAQRENAWYVDTQADDPAAESAPNYCPTGECICESPCDWTAEDYVASTEGPIGFVLDACCLRDRA
jgi:hypothetical protein